MKRVTGIGGIFFGAKDPAALRAWYRTHLGVDVLDWGGAVFQWADDPKPDGGMTVWSVNALEEGARPFTINYRVADLPALLEALRAEGCQVLDKTDESEFGKFGWVVDPEGNKVELWEPPGA
jgi:predicted enzyme related to lactoylglutathione lyase